MPPVTIATEADAPRRFAPAAIMASAVALSRMPPDALTPISLPTSRRISAMSSAVAPPPPKPVLVFTNAAPADFDSAQYADAFDAKMGDPLTALGRLTPFAAPAAEPAPSPRPWTHWAKVDPRSRELAKLRTGAEKREKAAKTTATRDAAKADKNAYLNESKARQKRLRAWLDAGKGIIDGDALYYFDAAGTKIKWVPSPTPHFFLPY